MACWQAMLDDLFFVRHLFVVQQQVSRRFVKGIRQRTVVFVRGGPARRRRRAEVSPHHFRARPWSLELIEEMDLSKSMAVYRDRFADAGDFTFFFVGNFTLEQVEPLVCTYLGGLPAAGRKEQWRDPGVETPKGVVAKKVYRGIEPKSQSQLVFTGPFKFDGWRNNFQLDAMAAVLDIKLREVLREDLGGTYGVGVGTETSRYPEGKYRINLSFGCDPARVEELTQTIFAQIDSLKTIGPAGTDIEKVKEIRKRQRQVALKENRFWINRLQWADSHGIDPRLTVRYEAMVDSLDSEAVRAAAQQYFNMDNYVRAVLYPGNWGKASGN